MKAASSKDAVQATRLLSLKSVCAMTSLTKPTIYELIKDGDFPSPVQVSKRRIAWREKDIDAWIASLETVTWAA